MKINPHAELLASWTFNEVLRTKPRQPYPLEGAKAVREKDGERQLKLQKPRKKSKSQKHFTDKETFHKVEQLRKTLERGTKQVEEILTRGTNISAYRYSHVLGDFVGTVQSALIRASKLGEGDPKAAEIFAMLALKAAVELREMTRRQPKLMKPIAERFGAWPVPYVPQTDARSELDEEMKSLGVATQSLKPASGRWSNRAAEHQPFRKPVGEYANRMGYLIDTLRADKTLGLVLRNNAVGWPNWAVQATQLPNRTPETMPQWFDVGWQILIESCGGDLETIPGLYPVGQSNAEYAKRQATTSKGKGGKHKSRYESDIKKALYKAFLSRFGN